MNYYRLSLSELNSQIRRVLQDALPDECWVQAEISEIKTNASGHCYLELIEKSASGDQLKARNRAVIWSSVWLWLRMRFEEQTGTTLRPGHKILAKVTVHYHEVYGLSLTIVDIDPSFTLGEWAMRRQQIIQQLERDGLIDLNRELAFPLLPQRVAVISSANAAGYGDFMHQLHQSPFAFYTKLFPAVVQGDRAEDSLLAALEAIMHSVDQFDVVVLIRGGGAVTDLSCFDQYLLCAAIAQFPLPIITGIGHERDVSVADRVAHVSVKTPTAVAEFLIEAMQQQWQALSLCSDRLFRLSQQQVMTVAQRLQRLSDRLKQGALERLQSESLRCQRVRMIVESSSRNLLLQARHKLDLLEKEIMVYSPEQQLKRGFSLVTCRGRLLKSVADVQLGDVIETRLADGSLLSRVEQADV